MEKWRQNRMNGIGLIKLSSLLGILHSEDYLCTMQIAQYNKLCAVLAVADDFLSFLFFSFFFLSFFTSTVTSCYRCHKQNLLIVICNLLCDCEYDLILWKTFLSTGQINTLQMARTMHTHIAQCRAHQMTTIQETLNIQHLPPKQNKIHCTMSHSFIPIKYNHILLRLHSIHHSLPVFCTLANVTVFELMWQWNAEMNSIVYSGVFRFTYRSVTQMQFHSQFEWGMLKCENFALFGNNENRKNFVNVVRIEQSTFSEQ